MSRRALLSLAQRREWFDRVRRGGWQVCRGNHLVETASFEDMNQDNLRQTFTFKDFDQAWSFMDKVAGIAKEMDHHPDWSNVYNKVIIQLRTHAPEKGLTLLDVEMAEQISAVRRLK